MRLLSAIATLALALGAVTSAQAAGYMKIGDIKGESTDSGHKDWIEIQTVSMPVHKPGGGASGAQRSRGDTTLGDIVVVREVDASTPKLQEAMANGTVFQHVEIDVVDSSQPRGYLRYKLERVLITSYQLGSSDTGSAAGDAVPTEQLSLNYEKITRLPSAQSDSRKGKVDAKFKVEEGK